MKHYWKLPILMVALSALSFGTESELVPDADQVIARFAELDEPITLVLTGNRRFEGTVVEAENNRVVLRVVQAGGEIQLGFSYQEILEIRFPGEELLADTQVYIAEEKWEQALPAMEALLLQRRPLFALLEQREKERFLPLPKIALHNNQPARAIAYAEFLQDHLPEEAEQKRLEESLLLAYYLMGLNNQAKELAEEWIQTRPRYHSSALGYFVRSALYFENEHYDEAFWLSLEPIVFSGQTPVDFLAHSYAIAIASAHLSGRKDYSQKLQREMLYRGLDWQYLNAFQEVMEPLQDLLVLQQETDEALPLFEALAPEENLLMDLDRSVGDGSFIDPSSIVFR